MAKNVLCLNEHHGERFAAYHGDCVDVVRQLPDDSVGFAIYSPPFSNLFVYSDSQNDMGNCSSDAEFMEQYAFLVRDLYRVIHPGRLIAVHCSDLPRHKWKDGRIGIKDFSGDLIRTHESHGWNLHSRVTIWKCPVVEMTRTKAHGLLYKTLQSDSGRSRQGMADYLLVFRKEGENANPITHTPEEFPLDQWQEWASPVWMDINQSNTLNIKQSRADKDERHICPLQLDLIKRALIMWSNPGDVVLSPFMGIGSEGVCALELGRRFVGVELKLEYWQAACQHLSASESQRALFQGAAA